MAEEQSPAHALLALGQEHLGAELYEDAIATFREAHDLFQGSGDEIGSLDALTKLLRALIAKGDAQEALDMAKARYVQFQARWNLIGEISMLEQMMNAYAALSDAEAADKLASKTLEHLREYEALGLDTTSGQALMWYWIALSAMMRRETVDAIGAAEMAAKLFSDAENYEYESLAVKIYNQALDQKNSMSYFEAEKMNFYLGVSIGGIQYGPRYRNNNIITVKPEGSNHIACCLHLTAPEGEEWEHEVAFHPGLIDAGGHVSFANGLRPDYQAQMAENAKDPKYVPDGPSIPFLMDAGELRPRTNPKEIYVTVADDSKGARQAYMFSH
jgi:hypothetical protein